MTKNNEEARRSKCLHLQGPTIEAWGNSTGKFNRSETKTFIEVWRVETKQGIGYFQIMYC